MRIVKTAFFASDPIALDAISHLKNSAEFPLACVVSNPDRPKGRGKLLSPNEVSAWALENGVELLRPEHGPDDATVSRLRELGVELIVVMAYGCMLRENILNYGMYPCLNLHASILPKYRGASPIETAIALCERETGVSLMRIEKKMDSGAVCDVEKIAIADTDTSKILRRKIREASPEILARNLCAVRDGTAVFVEQNHTEATYCRKLDKSDARIDFNKRADEIDARTRAFGFGIFERNGEVLKVCGAVASSEKSAFAGEAGTVVAADGVCGLRVKCGGGSEISFALLQRPCAKMMDAKEFFLGYKIGVGEVLKSSENKSLLR